MDVDAEHVTTNLLHYNSWTTVNAHSIDTYTFISGIPPNKLQIDDDENQLEWLVPIKKDYNITIHQINDWFSKIDTLTTTRPKRLTAAIINDDSTIVYYFIHAGVVKPRQN